MRAGDQRDQRSDVKPMPTTARRHGEAAAHNEGDAGETEEQADAFRHVIRSSRKAAARTAVSTGLALMMSADRPDETLCMPT